MKRLKPLGPDPWEGVDLTPPPRAPQPERPPGSRVLRDRHPAGVHGQADALGLELTSDITFNLNDFEYSAWASPAADKDQT